MLLWGLGGMRFLFGNSLLSANGCLILHIPVIRCQIGLGIAWQLGRRFSKGSKLRLSTCLSPKLYSTESRSGFAAIKGCGAFILMSRESPVQPGYLASRRRDISHEKNLN